MNNLFLRIALALSVVLAGLFSAAHADEVRNSVKQSFTGEYLNQSDKQYLELYEKETQNYVPKLKVQGGRVTIPYRDNATVLAGVMDITSIELEEGESCLEYNVSDRVRWEVIRDNSSSQARQLVKIKPKETDTFTSLVIKTDRRNYVLTLKSVGRQVFSLVNFDFSESEKEDGRNSSQVKLPAARGLNFDDCYQILGENNDSMPVRVYNDGFSTYLVFNNEGVLVESAQVPGEGSWIGKHQGGYELTVSKNGSIAAIKGVKEHLQVAVSSVSGHRQTLEIKRTQS